MQVLFPSSLLPRQRAALHAIAEQHGLQHTSSGEGQQRRLTLGGPGGGSDLDLTGQAAALSDQDLCRLLKRHYGIEDAAAQFTVASQPSSSDARGARGNAAQTSSSSEAKRPQPSLDEYIELTQRLIDLEREAEVQQATDATQLRSPESAQARGSALLNLRCDDVEGGLLGRSLLTLVCNKGYVAGGGGKGAAALLPLLPAHKFGPHDVVALRPSKGASEGPPLAQGVVYRLRDSAIVVAVDEPPEEGLDQPLRLEKLANEVRGANRAREEREGSR
jgi:ATP-dependent RNA/DNA helicase IGHMBP2